MTNKKPHKNVRAKNRQKKSPTVVVDIISAVDTLYSITFSNKSQEHFFKPAENRRLQHCNLVTIDQ